MKNGVLPILLKLPINSAHTLAARAHHICQRGILAALSALAFSAGLSGQSLAAAEPKFPDAAAWTLRWGESSGDWLFYPARLTQQSGRFLAGDVHSGDGVTWQKWTLPGDIKYWVNSIAATDGTFVLTGAANDLWTSPDGAEWTKRANPGGYDDLMGITFGAGKIVVHRFWSPGSMIVSGDGGQSWTYVDTGGFNYAPGSDSRHYERSVFGNGLFVFPLFDSVRTSSSGTTWTTHTITNRPPSFSMAHVSYYDEESQTFSGVQQTASSSTTKTITTATSADGSQWDFHAAEIATTNSHSYSGGAIGGGLMAISGGSPPDVWVSSDRGRSWSQVAGPWQNTNVTRVALAASDSRLVAALDAGPAGQIYSAEIPASPQAVLYVATTGDDAAGTGSEGSPFATIQKAVAVADAGTTISVGPGNYSGNFTIDKPDLTVRSQQGPAATHIASAARDSVFYVTANGEGAVIEGFTVTGGTGRPQPSSYGFDYYGGAIHAQSSMEVRNCILTGNGAGTPRVDSCTFGGAIYSAGQSDDVVLVENCVLANNFAWASGGASLTERSTIIFDRCTIWGNTSTDFFGNQGGLSAAWSGKIIVRNSILWGNGGSQLGAFGGIYASGTSGELHYSTIQGSVSGGDLAAFAAGEGNLTSDPLLSAPAAGDFTLSANSPARDAGDPSAPRDPDGTRADMGYLSIRFQLAVTQMVYVVGGSLPSSSALAGQSVGDFEIGRTEVTWGEWQLVRGWGAARGYDIVNAGQGSGDNHPVRNVTWYDVVKWCNAKSEMNGLDPVYLLGNGSAYRAGTEIPTKDTSATGYRLPTEREWEWAARGGIMSQGFTYSGSEAVDEVAWYDGNSLQAPVILENGRGSWPVGLKKSNELGLFDMSGNVFEWCWDEDNLRNRYTRGGGWHFYSAPACRVFDRSIARSTGTQNSYTGLRLARSLEDSDGDGLTDAWERGVGRYQVVEGDFTWQQAKADAESRGGHLATITSQAEQDLIVSLFEPELREGRSGTWVGAYQISKTDEPSGNWAWVNGEQWSFTNWNVAPDNHQGDQDYGYIIGDIPGFSKWDDAPSAGGINRYLLEFGYPTDPLKADTDGDGFDDKTEHVAGTDPNNPLEFPSSPVGNSYVSVFRDFDAILQPGVWHSHKLAPTSTDCAYFAKITPYAEETGSAIVEKTVIESEYGDGEWSDVLRIMAPANQGNDLRVTVRVFKVAKADRQPLRDAAVVRSHLSFPADLQPGTWHGWVLGETRTDVGYLAKITPHPDATDRAVLLEKVVVQSEWNGSVWRDVLRVMTPANQETLPVQVRVFRVAVRQPGDAVASFASVSQIRSMTVTLEPGVWHGYLMSRASDNRAYLSKITPLSSQIWAASLDKVVFQSEWNGQLWNDVLRVMSPSSAEAWDAQISVFEVQPSTGDKSPPIITLIGSNPLTIYRGATFSDPGAILTDNVDPTRTVYGSGAVDISTVGSYSLVYSARDAAGNAAETITRIVIVELDPLGDEDGDGLRNDREQAVGTDPYNPDSDGDGLYDGVETGSHVYIDASDTGTDPLNPDTSGDGILDGEAVQWNFNPLTDHTQVLAFLRHATGNQSGRFGLYTEGSIMDLNLGGVMLQKTGNQASVRFKVESKMDLRDASWTDRGTYLLPPLEMPGSKGFLRIRAEQH